VPGYQPIMPDLKRILSGGQIWAVIAYLQSLGGEVTVTGDDVAAAEAEGGGGAAAAGGAGSGGVGLAGGATDAMELIRAAGCIACHKLGAEGAPIGPPFDGIGARLDAERIRRSILEPNADTAQGFEAFAGTMPLTFGQQFSAAQLEALVRYLTSLR
jgi:mono/diheme cytochrome c family protein